MMNKKQLETWYKFMGSTTQSLADIKDEVHEIKSNHLVHLNKKVDSMVYTILGSIVLGILAVVYKMFF